MPALQDDDMAMHRALLSHSPRAAAPRLGGLVVAAFVVFATACHLTDRPDPPTPSRALVVPGDGYHAVLDNGLTLFIAPDEHTRAVQLDVRHAVGSRDDPAGKGELAHVVEHLMFELLTDGAGSRTLGDEANETSLLVNAYTSADETHYMYSGMPSQLEMYFRHAARRLEFDCDELDDATFLRVREVVLNEIRWRYGGLDARVLDRVVAEVFPEGHPYRTTRDDREAQIVALTRQDACDFVAAHYTASRTTVVVTGAVEPEQIVALTNAKLAGIPDRAVPARTPVPPVQPRDEPVVIEVPVATSLGALIFPLPSRFHEDHAAAQAAMLTVGLILTVSTFFSDIAIDDWGFVQLGGKEAPVLVIALWPDEPEQLDEALELAPELIDEIFEREFRKGTYDRARQRRRLEIVNSVAHIETRATAYADYLEQGDDPGFVAAELAVLDNLTEEQVHAVGRRVFSSDRATTLKIVPKADAEVEADRVVLEASRLPESFDRRTRPWSDAADSADVLLSEEGARPTVPIEQLELSNGMRVILVHSSEYPLIDIQLVINAGTLHTPEQPLVALLADSLYLLRNNEAAARTNLLALSGGDLLRQVGPRTTIFRAQGLSIYLDFLIAGLAESHAYARYSERSFEAWKTAALKRLDDDDLQESLGLSQAYAEALYGQGHPYTQTQGDIARLRGWDVKRFHNTHYRAANSTVIVTGGFDRDLVIEHLEWSFAQPRDYDLTASWQRSGIATEPIEIPKPAPKGGTIITRELEGDGQTEVLIGYPLRIALGPEQAGLAIITKMIELEVESVREVLGASYGIEAILHADWPRIEVGGSVDSQRAAEAFTEIRAALARVGDEQFERRFARAKRLVLRSLLEAQADPQRLGEQMAWAVASGLVPDYTTRLLPLWVEEMSAEGTRMLLERVLSEDRAVTFIQGPPEGIERVLSVGGTRLLDGA